MKKLILILIGLTFIFMSCSKNESESNEKLFNATVLGKGLDCGNSYLLKFNNSVSGLPQNNSDNVFYEINLPWEYKVAGEQIYVEFRQPENAEIIICTYFGFTYPQIYITHAE